MANDEATSLRGPSAGARRRADWTGRGGRGAQERTDRRAGRRRHRRGAARSVVPGFVAEVRTSFAQPGEYEMPCHEFCGLGHHAMWTRVSVVPKDQFAAQGPLERQRHREQRAAEGGVDQIAPAKRSRQQYAGELDQACHRLFLADAGLYRVLYAGGRGGGWEALQRHDGAAHLHHVPGVLAARRHAPSLGRPGAWLGFQVRPIFPDLSGLPSRLCSPCSRSPQVWRSPGVIAAAGGFWGGSERCPGTSRWWWRPACHW